MEISKPIVIDLCSGTGSATKPFKRDGGFDVWRIDSDERHDPDVVADVRNIPYCLELSRQPFFVWASPPCAQFTRESLPWIETDGKPDMSIVSACWEFIKKHKPDWWIIENVAGAIPFFNPVLGRPRQIIGAFHLWGNFPPLPQLRVTWKQKQAYAGNQIKQRATIPPRLARAIFESITSQTHLWRETQ